ncbi:HAD-IA family hydrolase [Levilactobacillus mulengensis]|uniref:HAD-IA family hydrolase n=1 Tax=Levilactobacillus mulengensis TaxID=2486025 RepID=UPI000F76EB0D|nr:HAD-IA family hydrolase [Levilactobacillus mulengensis]
MRYQQLFWDFDGTLVDTYPGMVAAFCDALEACGVNNFELDEDEIYKAMRQHSLGNALQRFTAEFRLNRERLAKVYQQEAAPRLKDAPAFAGVAEVLAANVAAGGRNFLLTHRDHHAMDRLSQLNLAQYFTGAVTADDDYPRKPDPTSLIALSKQYDVQREDALMIGDRNLDVQAGHRAGMAGALFDPEHLIVDESQPEIRVIRYAELQDWLTEE